MSLYRWWFSFKGFIPAAMVVLAILSAITLNVMLWSDIGSGSTRVSTDHVWCVSACSHMVRGADVKELSGETVCICDAHTGIYMIDHRTLTMRKLRGRR